ncbi:helix-turn-helix domain-containing protein [Azotobacter beijerinckii]|nr:helix-turn-helix domain-containing protein [Azotobacter beijerinckii]
MLRRQAFKFRIEPTGEQQSKLQQFAGMPGSCSTKRWHSSRPT